MEQVSRLDQSEGSLLNVSQMSSAVKRDFTNCFSWPSSCSLTLLFLLQPLLSEASQGLQTSGLLLLCLHPGSGPQAVGQHPPPAASGPEDCLLLPEDGRCLAQGLPAAAPQHHGGRREGGAHAALPARVNGRFCLLLLGIKRSPLNPQRFCFWIQREVRSGGEPSTGSASANHKLTASSTHQHPL